MNDKQLTSVRFSREAFQLLDLIAKELGISRSAVLEMIIREKAKALGLKK